MKYKNLILVAPAISFAITLISCTQSQPQLRMEKSIPAATPAAVAQASPAATIKLPPPNAADVQQAVQRVFGDALAFTGAPGSFIVGDFNGDGSEDLALVAHPASGKLAEINSEVANWVIQDAERALIVSPKQSVVRFNKEELPKVAAGETVLAIIHGYGAKGWRNPEARQAYLVKHAAGLFEGTAPSVQEKAIRAMHLPVETEIIKARRGRKRGFVFWTGGEYAWHPVSG